MYQEAKDWKENAWLILKSKYRGEIIDGDVIIGEITFYLKRRRDIQGSLKLLFDAMEGIFYRNDQQVAQFGPVIRKSDKSNPRIEAEIIN